MGALSPYMQRYAPHRAGAADSSAAYKRSAEHRQDQAVVEGATLYEMDPAFACSAAHSADLIGPPFVSTYVLGS
jgi:hypothetical protein